MSSSLEGPRRRADADRASASGEGPSQEGGGCCLVSCAGVPSEKSEHGKRIVYAAFSFRFGVGGGFRGDVSTFCICCAFPRLQNR